MLLPMTPRTALRSLPATAALLLKHDDKLPSLPLLLPWLSGMSADDVAVRHVG
jgi:hypothetical protein